MKHIIAQTFKRKPQLQHGIVKWFGESGYGFITPDDGTKDVFVHFTNIASAEKFRCLEQGEKVSFTLTVSPRGPEAQAVTVI